ncbi:hypothetical protein Tco_0138321 [Tanacetum coccineum]
MKLLVVTTPGTPSKHVEEFVSLVEIKSPFNLCPLTRGGNDFPVFHDNIQQFQQTAAVANDANMNNLQMKLDNFQRTQNDFQRVYNESQKKQDDFQKMMLGFMQNYHTNNFKFKFCYTSNTIPNPRNEAKAITTRSGVLYDGPPIIPPVVEKESEVTKDTELPSTEDIQPPPFVQEQPKDKEPSEEPSFVANKAKPNLPYPSRLNKQKIREKDDILASKFMEIFRNLHFELSFADALIHMPKFAPMFKKMLNNKDKLIELTKTPLNENCSAVVLKKLPEKLGDPGRFLIPCDFSEFDSYLALADLGAGAEGPGIGVKNFTVLQIWLFLISIDRSSGTVNSGRPFLRTANALIDVSRRRDNVRNDDQSLTLKCGDAPSISYNNLESLKKVDLIDVLVKSTHKKLLRFSDSLLTTYLFSAIIDPIVSISSPTLLPFDEKSDGDISFSRHFSTMIHYLHQNQGDYSPGIQKDLKVVEPKESSLEPKDEIPKVELKELPPHLEYALLEENNKLPVIISKDLSQEERPTL